MSLTDGENGVQAMEYQPIPQLNTEVLPGTKVSIWNIHMYILKRLDLCSGFRMCCSMKIAHVYIDSRQKERVVKEVCSLFSCMQLLLQGTIDCRLGTLLLSGSHVQVLGGGVESLVDVNQQRRVLARAL